MCPCEQLKGSIGDMRGGDPGHAAMIDGALAQQAGAAFGMLPHHAKWATFLMRLEYVVIDELHVLRGVFGTHVAHLLRRLRRLCLHYGSDPTFIFSSATIGEPGRLASDLCGLDVAAVTDDGSPRGERRFVLWNPNAEPVVDLRALKSRGYQVVHVVPAARATAAR